MGLKKTGGNRAAGGLSLLLVVLMALSAFALVFPGQVNAQPPTINQDWGLSTGFATGSSITTTAHSFTAGTLIVIGLTCYGSTVTVSSMTSTDGAAYATATGLHPVDYAGRETSFVWFGIPTMTESQQLTISLSTTGTCGYTESEYSGVPLGKGVSADAGVIYGGSPSIQQATISAAAPSRTGSSPFLSYELIVGSAVMYNVGAGAVTISQPVGSNYVGIASAQSGTYASNVCTYGGADMGYKDFTAAYYEAVNSGTVSVSPDAVLTWLSNPSTAYFSDCLSSGTPLAETSLIVVSVIFSVNGVIPSIVNNQVTLGDTGITSCSTTSNCIRLGAGSTVFAYGSTGAYGLLVNNITSTVALVSGSSGHAAVTLALYAGAANGSLLGSASVVGLQLIWSQQKIITHGATGYRLSYSALASIPTNAYWPVAISTNSSAVYLYPSPTSNPEYNDTADGYAPGLIGNYGPVPSADLVYLWATAQTPIIYINGQGGTVTETGTITTTIISTVYYSNCSQDPNACSQTFLSNIISYLPLIFLSLVLGAIFDIPGFLFGLMLGTIIETGMGVFPVWVIALVVFGMFMFIWFGSSIPRLRG